MKNSKKFKRGISLSIIFILLLININIPKVNAAEVYNYDDVLVGIKNFNNTTNNSAQIGDVLTKPEKGWKRYDDKNSKIVADGYVRKTTGGSSLESVKLPYMGSESSTIDNNSSYKFSFIGTKVRLIATVGGTSLGKPYMNVFGDGKQIGTVSISHTPVYPQSLIFEYDFKVFGKHDIEIKHTHEQGSNPVAFPTRVDAIDLDGELVDESEDDSPSRITNFQLLGDTIVNNTLTLKGDATPANESLYKFWVCDRSTGTWIDLTGYTSNKEINWTPTKPGRYTVVLHVKNKASANAYDDYRGIDFVVKYVPSKLSEFIVEGDKVVNSNIVMKANATPSDQTLYKFWVGDRDTDVWTDLTGYTTNNQTSWKPTKPGRYRLVVHSKNKYSSNAQDDYKYIDIVVK